MIDGVRVIDFHGHVGANDIMGMVDDPDLMLHTMDSCGIDVSCVFNIYYPDGTTGNDMTARFVARRPDRFVGFAYVCPLMPADSMVAELERAIDDLGLVAIKLYPPFVHWSLEHPIWDPIYEFANERGTGPHPSHRNRVAGLSASSWPTWRPASPRSSSSRGIRGTRRWNGLRPSPRPKPTTMSTWRPAPLSGRRESSSNWWRRGEPTGSSSDRIRL